MRGSERIQTGRYLFGRDRGAFLELCAMNRGYELKAFRDFEAAFTWLNEGGQPSTSSGYTRYGI